MTKVLICGDSFAADWTVKYPGIGWPNLLAKEFDVTNIAQAGCSEYKIYKQLIKENLDEYDVIIMSHTSALRIYIETEHPVHYADPLHKNSDLIFTDLEEHGKNRKDLQPILEYFTKFYSLEHAEFVYSMTLDKIFELLKDRKVIHVTNIQSNTTFPFEVINFFDIFKKHRGLLNHFDDIGNQIVFEKVKKEIYSLLAISSVGRVGDC